MATSWFPAFLIVVSHLGGCGIRLNDEGRRREAATATIDQTDSTSADSNARPQVRKADDQGRSLSSFAPAKVPIKVT